MFLTKLWTGGNAILYIRKLTKYNDFYISHVIYNDANASETKTAEQYIL